MPELDFNLDILDKEVSTIKPIEPKVVKQDLKDVTYTLSYLAKLEEGQHLEGNLKKARNAAAKGGSEYELVFINNTDLVLRREYVRKAKLLVIIPEKAIYNIYDELSGVLLSSNDPDAINKFISKLPGELATQIQAKLVWDMLSRSSSRWNSVKCTYEHFYNLSYSTSSVVRNSYSAPRRQRMAYLTKNRPFVENKDMFKAGADIAGSFAGTPEGDAAFKIALKLYAEFRDTVSSTTNLTNLTSLRLPNINILDINVARHCVVKAEELNRKIRDLERQGAVTRHFYSDSRVIEPRHIAKLKNLGVDIDKWFEWALYIEQIEEYNMLSHISHYFDVIQQQIELNNGKVREKYPKMWLTYEHKIQAIYRRNEKFLKEKREFTYTENIMALEHQTAKDNKDWDHVLVLPKTYGDLIEEGAGMKNCVANYGDRVYNHETVVLLLRRKKKQDQSWVTVEVQQSNESTYDLASKPYRLTQVKGISNTNPDDEAIWYLAKWMELPHLKGKIEVEDWYIKRRLNEGVVEAYEKYLEEKKAKEKEQREKQAQEATRPIEPAQEEVTANV